MKMSFKDEILHDLKKGKLFEFITMTDDEKISLYEVPNEIEIHSKNYSDKEQYRKECIKFVENHKHFLGNGKWI